MSKKTLLKGIIAVSAATTMLFSTAFAAKIDSTSTLYVRGAEVTTVEVTTVVSGLSAGQEVTYLAGEASNPVYINQYTVPDTTDGIEEYTYKTTRNDFAGATVKMAKAESDFTGGAAIDVSAASTILDATKFTFTLTDGATTVTKSVDPNEVVNSTIIAFEYTLPAGKLIDTLKVDGIEAAYKLGTGVITVTHGVTDVFGEGNALNKTSAEIVITLKDEEVFVPELPAYKSGFKTPSYTYGEGEDAVTGPMYAIYATSEKLPTDCSEFGVAINTSKDILADGWEFYASKAVAGSEFGIAIIEANPENIPDVVYARTYYIVGDVTSLSNDVITINVPKAN